MIFIKFAKQETGLEFIKEYRFHPVRLWRFDYACLDIKIAVEVEGGRWSKKSRHTTGKGYENDCEKYNQAVIHGWRVIRVFPETLLTISTIDMIKQLKDGLVDK